MRLKPEEYRTIATSIPAALEASLKRLGLESVDLYQMHNRVTEASEGDALSADAYLADVVPTMQKLKQQGKIRAFGITALGETKALHRVVDSGAFDTAQICYNALNPSADSNLPSGYPAQDYSRLMTRAHSGSMGTIGIRVLAGGALSGSEFRHPLNVQSVEPIGSAMTFRSDVERARRLEPMVREGHVSSLSWLSASQSRARRFRRHWSALRTRNNSKPPLRRQRKGRCHQRP